MELADQLKRMATFRAAVEAGSFAQAARHLRVSRAAVSKQIQQLEDFLGVTLMHRSSRHLRLTEAGEACYPACCDMLAAAERVVGAAHRLSSEPRGTLRVSSAVGVGVHLLAPGLAAFCHEYPELTVALELSDDRADLWQERFDLLLRAGHLPDSDLMARKLTTIDMVVCASPGHVRERGAPTEPRDLEAREFAMYSPLGIPMRLRFVHAQTERAEIVTVSGRVQTNNADVIAELVRNNFGLGLFPRTMVADDLAAGRMCALLETWRFPEIPVFAVYPAAEHVPTKVRCFVDFYADYLSRQAEATG